MSELLLPQFSNFTFTLNFMGSLDFVASVDLISFQKLLVSLSSSFVAMACDLILN